ncbi:ABC transporter ATP-binding protein [Mucilaginibacter corticis]|nr:ABC transporter ATP-binding protein [Mucilaginibacter corticis]
MIHSFDKVRRVLKEVKLARTLRLIWSLSPATTTFMFIMIVVENLLFFLTAYAFKYLFGVIVSPAKYDAEKIVLVEKYLLETFIAISLYVIVKSISQYVSQVQASRVSEFIDDKIHAAAVDLDLAFYESPEYFDTLKLAKDAGAERPNQVVTTLVDVVKNALMFCGISFVIFTINWLILPILIICVIPTFLVRVALADKLYQLREKQTPVERQAAYLSSLITADTLAKEVRSFGLGDYIKRLYLTIRLDLLVQRLKIIRRGAIHDIVTSLLGSFGFFGCICFFCYNAMKGTITIGQISLFVIIFPQLFNILQSLSQGISGLYQNGIFLTQLFKFFDLKPTLVDKTDTTALPVNDMLELKMENVNFTYPNSSNPVLTNVNLSIPPGKVIAIVGLNGAGKTTLIKLLCRLYDPTSGSVILGEENIRNFKIEDFRKTISAVFQDFGKYNLSVADNIRFGDIYGNRPFEDMVKATEASGANEYIEEFPNKYETIMGRIFEDGREISIGQWQKLAIARALYSPSRFIILDEATSALDALAEYEFLKNFRKSIGNKGAIVISHRVSAVKHADYIYVMSHGQVAQSGTHEELIAMDGDYATLFKDDKEIEA